MTASRLEADARGRTIVVLMEPDTEHDAGYVIGIYISCFAHVRTGRFPTVTEMRPDDRAAETKREQRRRRKEIPDADATAADVFAEQAREPSDVVNVA